MTERLPFTELSIRRRIAAARKEGLRVVGIGPDGTVLVNEGDVPVAPNATQAQHGASSEFEDFRA